MRPMRLARACVLPAAVAASVPALAAGGHHAVDDANILEPGNCKAQGWLTNEDGGERLLHADIGCRVGPVELNAAAIYAHEHDKSSQSGSGLQVKWATEVAPRFSAGLEVAGAWQAHARSSWIGATLATLFTWTPRGDLAVHLNVGRDFVDHGTDMAHSGVAVEWTASPGWSFVGERFVQLQTQYLRAGARWAVDKTWTVDLSRAHSLSGRFGSLWTLGASWQFDRR